MREPGLRGQRTKTPPPQRLRRPPTPPSCSLLDYDLPVHPRVRCADVEVCPRLGEGDGLRFPLIEWAGIPIADFALVERGGRVRDVQAHVHVAPVCRFGRYPEPS